MRKSSLLTLAISLSLLAWSVPTADALWPFGDKDEKKQAETSEEVMVESEATTQDDGAMNTPAAPAKTEAQAQPAATPSKITVPDEKAGTQTKNEPRVKIVTPKGNNFEVNDPIESEMLPIDRTYTSIDDPSNPMGITKSAERLNESARLIGEQKYAQAEAQLVPLKDWLIDATEVHITLHKTLKGLPSAQVQAELEKQLALQFALLRDKAFFQLGMLAVGKTNAANAAVTASQRQEYQSEAIKNLSRVVQSQPRSPMGIKAYDMLQQIGFTEKIQLKKEANAS